MSPAALRLGAWLPAAVLTVGVALSAAGATWLLRDDRAEADASFQRIVLRASDEIMDRYRKPSWGLAGARGMLVTHPHVQRATFGRYVTSRNLPVEFPGVRGFGFIERVPRAELPAFVARERADGAPQFAVRQLDLKSEPESYVIKHIEPADRNMGAMGLDVGSEAVRRQGVMAALESGEITMTGVITLVQDEHRTPGALIYLPVYAEPTPAQAAAGRLGTLRGLVYAPVVHAEILAGLGDVAADLARVELFDTPSGTPDGPLIFDSEGGRAPGDSAQATRSARHEVVRVIDLPGRLVTLRMRSTPAFEAAYGKGGAWALGLGGLLTSALLAGLLRQQILGRGRAERLAQAMTADLERLAMVARRTSNAVVITDAQRRITWVNEGFERVSGYSAAEALGRSPGALLQCEATDPATVQALRRALDAGEGFRGEILNRARDGRVYWLDLDIQPLRDALGRLTGFMAVETDISDLKRAERGRERERQSLQNIIEGTQVGTWEWNVETGETVFNERWAQIIGYSLAELGPTSIDTWVKHTHPDDLRQSSIALERHFDGKSLAYECEARMRHRDGHWVWVLDRGKLFSRGAEGRPRWMAGTHMDITERKRAEAALRASQTLLNQTGRIGGIGGWELDVATQTLAWTDQTCRIHDLPAGHQPTLAEALGYYTDESRPLIESVVQRGMATGEGYDLELSMVTATGRHIWVRAIGEVERVDGRPVRLAGVVQDITQRRELQAEVQRQAGLLRGAIDALDEAFVLYDPEDRLVLCNERFRQTYATSADLIVPGARFEDIVRAGAERGDYPEASGRIDAWVAERVAAHRAASGTVVQPLSSGHTLRIVERRLADGHTVGFRIDITELVQARQRAEQATVEAARALARLQAIYDILPVGLTVTDPQGHIIDCNPASERLLGITKADHLARAYDGREWQVLREDGSVMPTEEFASVRALTQRRPVHDALMQVVTPQRSVWLSVSAMPVQHEDLGVVVGYVDVTEQRAQQQALLEAKSQAEQASVAKSQFLANMSHEIRTPMNAILGMLALLRRTELSPRQADYAAKTEGAARSLLGLLNDILDFSKVEAGRMTLDLHTFGVDALLRDVGVILSTTAGAKPVEVLFDVDPALPQRLVGDSMRLRQVLINLGGNAVKFTDAGEVVVALRQVSRDGDRVTLQASVRDTGIGIAPEHQARIFSGFTQAEASTTRRYGGTGLGVAISQRLVGLMGGTLELDSEVGRGSTFSFRLTLPVAPADAADESREAAGSALVVDDNALAREVLQRMTQAMGWRADLATSGEEALALLAARRASGARYDAVFVDWQMPGLDGFETARRIREQGLDGGTALVVMVSAHGREMLEQRDGDEQALLDGFLVKPVTASMLLDAVTDARHRREQPHLSAAAGGALRAGQQRLAGLRLLVAEDNVNNQQVARELLGDEGAIVSIAANGQEAVAAVAAADPPFDVVLMDLQMPVMDGFTATARIRQDLGRGRLPIVAMTANAMASDREACLAAGMNEHIGKPFDLDRLVALLQRLAGRAPSEPAPAAAATGLDGALQQAASAAGVDLAAAVQRLGGKRPVYARMLGRFVDELPALSRDLQPPADGAAPALARTLHTLKGTAATLGVRALAADVAAAEALLPADAARAARQCLAALDAVQAPLAALYDALSRQDDGSPALQAAADGASWRSMLAELTALLDSCDMRATELIDPLLAQAGAAARPAWGSALGELEAAVAALDFEHAATLCRRLQQELGS